MFGTNKMKDSLLNEINILRCLQSLICLEFSKEYLLIGMHSAALRLLLENFVPSLALNVQGSILLSNPRIEMHSIVLHGEFENSSSSHHVPLGTVSTMAGFSSVVETDSIIVSPEVIVVIMATEDSLHVVHFFECCVESSIYREAAHILVLLAVMHHRI